LCARSDRLASNDKFLAANNKTSRPPVPIYGSNSRKTRFPSRKTAIVMIKTITGDLRTVAERCTRLARDCQRYELSRALQELGIELMTKASELEREFGE